MKRSLTIVSIICGWLMLAAFPVSAQNGDGYRLESKPVSDVKINRKPLDDLPDFVLEKIEKDKVDLSHPFKVVLEGSLVKQVSEDFEFVTFDKANSKWLVLSAEEAGDPQMAEIAKRAVEAVGDSGFLGHFYNLGVKKIKITLAQDNENAFAKIELEQPTEERARTLASGLNGLLSVAGYQIKDGTDERVLLEGAMKKRPTAEGKNVIITIELPKDVAREMVERNLAEYKKIRRSSE
ncbi:MAG: hypothetical protein R2747_12780 [Pyrinomonadaceae bacterium]